MINRVLTVALVFACVLPSVAARASDDPAMLLAHHREYAGWQLGSPEVGAIELHGTIGKVLKDGTVRNDYAVTDRRFGILERRSLLSTRSGLTYENGFTGKVFWYSDENGFTVPDRSDETKFDVSRSTLFNEDTADIEATIVGRQTIGGIATTVLRENVPFGVTMDLYEDTATGAYVRAVFDPKGNAETMDIDAYAEPAPGKHAISAYHFEGSSERYKYDTIAFKAPFDPQELHPPVATATWTFGTGAAFPIELRPIDDRQSDSNNSQEERIYVKATVNGVPGRFILDTGAGDIAFTDAFAKRAGLKAFDTTTVAGIGADAEKKVGLLRADTIAFGDQSTLQNVVVTSGIDLGDEKADGLLGFDFMGGAVVSLDLDGQKAHIADAGQFTPVMENAIVAVPDLSTGSPVLPMTIDGTTETHALIDSGAPSFALLSSEYLSKLRVIIDDSSLASTIEFGGATGAGETDRCGAIGNMTIGPIAYQHVQSCFSASVDRDNAIVGLDLLKHFNITLDYPDGKIYLYARK